ncbi:hypothetical protein BH10BAC5_BH10BAC5_13380 [soil metagenome]
MSRILTFATIILIFYSSAFSQQPLNLNFEKLSIEGNKRPWGWSVYSYSPDGIYSMDSIEKRSGKYSLKLSTKNNSQFAFGYWIAPQALYGKKIKLKGFYKTNNFKGDIRTGVESYGEDGVLSTLDSVNKYFSISKTTSDWKGFEINTTVTSGALSSYIILGINGKGDVLFDDLSLSMGEKTIKGISAAPDISSVQLKYLSRYTSELKYTDPGNDDSDLGLFNIIAGDSKIIGLGESTHGTSEFFRMKNRLLEYSVKNLGVRVFAIEANQMACERINKYVCEGIGTPEKLIKSLFAVWNTEEMLTLIKWLRDYNIQNPDYQVEFVGIDMQDPFLPMDSLDAFLTRHDPAIQITVKDLLAEYKAAWENQYYPTASDSILEIWKSNAGKVLKIISDRKNSWMQELKTRDDILEVEWAVQNANVIYQNAFLRSLLNGSLNSIYRDSCMASNLKWSLDRRGANIKTVLWAHDSHISKCSSQDPGENYFRGRSMGTFLSDMYGNDYKTFGLSTYEGTYSGTVSFSDYTMTISELFPSPKGSIDEALHQNAVLNGWNYSITDLRTDSSKDERGWLFQPRPVRFIGYASEDYTYAQIVSLPFQFDGLIFIDRSNHSNHLK